VAPMLRFTLRLARLLLVLATVLVPCGAATAYAPRTTPSASSDSPSPSASPGASRAATDPGQDRPGRSDDGSAARTEGKEDTDADDEDVDEDYRGGEDGDDETSPHRNSPRHPHRHNGDPVDPTASESPQAAGVVPSATPSADTAGQDVARKQDSSSDPALRLLPLGSGMILVGLGLGLAFVGLRVRRG
jgi:hypothetical protein